ncbi:hypothetical protein K1719_035196 [Acacia pycnantha]|nr:hypothetical protein K1719_035196 [Acacia pycnantha]
MTNQGTISLGPWGGSGGDHWSFNASLAITEIVITLVENNIHSISFKDASGNTSGTFGGRDPNAIQRVEKKVPIQWPSEYLRSISGTYGRYNGLSVIKSLSFITNLKTNGPFGTASDDDTPFPTQTADGVVVGFYGWAGYYVDAIGIFVQPAVDPYNGTISLGPWGGSDADGHCYGKFGGRDSNDTGVEKTVPINGPSEYLKSIKGTYGEYRGRQVITSLSFITNFDTHGPYGTASGTSFTIPIQGSLVIGFYGRAGFYVDSIGIIVKPAITN